MKKNDKITGMTPTRSEQWKHVACVTLLPLLTLAVLYSIMLVARGWAAAIIGIAVCSVLLAWVGSWEMTYEDTYYPEEDDNYTGDDLYE
ncbi:MAG: hypothetical protein KBT04_05900 [Bacteroidales bacterium]|nr:hypothetical protein [Candidatus Colimorpha onthohippi]